MNVQFPALHTSQGMAVYEMNENEQVHQNFDFRPPIPPPLHLQSPHLVSWLDQGAGQQQPAATTKPPGSKSRKRYPPGSEHIKHRRTRSGCLTCRHRRVKCDEKKPICDRCYRAGRECKYPDPAGSDKKKDAASDSKQSAENEQAAADHSSSEVSGADEDNLVSTSEAPATATSATSKARQSSSASSIPESSNPSSNTFQADEAAAAAAAAAAASTRPEDAPTPSTENGGQFASDFSRRVSEAPSSASVPLSIPSWGHLAPDLQFYLNYHRENLTFHHYFFKHETAAFAPLLLSTALQYDPLLYAVVGFAAFHDVLGKKTGKLQDFLGYYNKSVSLLRKSLQYGENHTDATLLTILQLAAFEEYLGDWSNLLIHQKAAYEMLLELYTPATIMSTEISRRILAWYARFDIFAGIMGGYETVLDIDWFMACKAFHEERIAKYPNNLVYALEAYAASHGVVAMEMSQLFAKLPRGAITIPEFLKQNERITQDIQGLKMKLAPMMARTEYKAIIPRHGTPDPNSIIDIHGPAGIYHGPLWSLNFLIIDWNSLQSLQLYQTSLILHQTPPAERLLGLALEQCRIIEAVQHWTGSPPAAILPAQACLALVCLFLPRDDKHIIWARRKLAAVENLGLIYPYAFRHKMAEFWAMPDIDRWWLPGDESYLPIIKSIRSFIEERTMAPRTQPGEDVRTIKALFSKLSMDDASPTTTSPALSGSFGQASPPASGAASGAAAGGVGSSREGSKEASVAGGGGGYSTMFQEKGVVSEADLVAWGSGNMSVDSEF